MKKGDLIKVHWVDIAAFPTSSPEEAHPIAMKTMGHFAGWFNDKKRGRYLCISDTLCEEGNVEIFYGSTAFPKGCIREIEEMTIRPTKKKKKPNEQQA